MDPATTTLTSTFEMLTGPQTYKCDANGSLLHPIQVGPLNETLTRAEQVIYDEESFNFTWGFDEYFIRYFFVKFIPFKFLK